jgi:YD repeat-containing protein
VVPDGSLWICASGGVFTPPGYIYTDSTGTSYTMNATGNLQSIQDRTGNTLTITPGGITSANGLTGATGLSVPFVRDGTHNNRITEIDDPQGNKYVYGYDTAGNLTSVTYPTAASSDPCSGATGSNITEYAYHTELLFPYNHLYAGGTDSRGCALPTSTYFPANTHDTNNNSLTGRLESVTDSLRHTTTYSYLIADNSTGVGSTSTTTITYPQDPADGNGAVDQATMVYDAYGMLLSSTDPLGNTTSNTYDANHNLIAVIDAMGQKTTYTYDANGNKTSIHLPGHGHRPQHHQHHGTTTVQRAHSNRRAGQRAPLQLRHQLQSAKSVTDSIGTLASFVFNPNQTLAGRSHRLRHHRKPRPGKPVHLRRQRQHGQPHRCSRPHHSYTYNSLGQKTSMTTPTPGFSQAARLPPPPTTSTTTWAISPRPPRRSAAPPAPHTTPTATNSRHRRTTATQPPITTTPSTGSSKPTIRRTQPLRPPNPPRPTTSATT